MHKDLHVNLGISVFVRSLGLSVWGVCLSTTYVGSEAVTATLALTALARTMDQKDSDIKTYSLLATQTLNPQTRTQSKDLPNFAKVPLVTWRAAMDKSARVQVGEDREDCLADLKS